MLTLKNITCLCLLFFVSDVAFSYDEEDYNYYTEYPCQYLYLNVTNATGTEVQLTNNPEYSVRHGYIFRRGTQTMPNGLTQIWTLHENTFAGPEGNITYSWIDRNNVTHTCEIDYNQTYCGFISAGENLTEVHGSCSIQTDWDKPSTRNYWHGESHITLLR